MVELGKGTNSQVLMICCLQIPLQKTFCREYVLHSCIKMIGKGTKNRAEGIGVHDLHELELKFDL